MIKIIKAKDSGKMRIVHPKMVNKNRSNRKKLKRMNNGSQKATKMKKKKN
jgi:hypothetical protein